MNKYQQEFIGKKILVKNSSNKEQKNISGTIIDETKNTFIVQLQSKRITLMKKDAEFLIGSDCIDGNKITKRPEERIKIKEK